MGARRTGPGWAGTPELRRTEGGAAGAEHRIARLRGDSRKLRFACPRALLRPIARTLRLSEPAALRGAPTRAASRAGKELRRGRALARAAGGVG